MFKPESLLDLLYELQRRATLIPPKLKYGKFDGIPDRYILEGHFSNFIAYVKSGNPMRSDSISSWKSIKKFGQPNGIFEDLDVSKEIRDELIKVLNRK